MRGSPPPTRTAPAIWRSAGNAPAASIPSWRWPSRPGRARRSMCTRFEGGEARLYCYSEARAKKERGIANRFAARFEGELKKLHDGLGRPRTRKRLDRSGSASAASRRRAAAPARTTTFIADQWREGARRHLEAPPARLHAHPSRRLLPAHQCRGLGRGGAVADLYLRPMWRPCSRSSRNSPRPIFHQTQSAPTATCSSP